MSKAVNAEIGIGFKKHSDSRLPVEVSIHIETDDGIRTTIELSSDDFTRLLSGSVLDRVALIDDYSG